MDDILKQKVEKNNFEEIFAFGVPKDAALRMRNFIKQYHKKRIGLKIFQKHIYDEDAPRRIEYLNKLPYTEVAFLPNSINSPATTTIYGDKVAFYIWSEPILSILIESERMAETYKNYFEILFNLAIKPKKNITNNP